MIDMPSERAQSFFQTIDTMRPDSIAALYAEDGRLVFGNAEPLVGREAITAGIEGFFSTIGGLQHRIVNDWQIGADTIAELEATYRRLDDKDVTVPTVSIWHTGDDGLVTECRVFFDLTPLYTA
jgi:hypothetical protein